jgi:hypothetical protein
MVENEGRIGWRRNQDYTEGSYETQVSLCVIVKIDTAV